MKDIKIVRQKWLNAQENELKSWTVGDLHYSDLIKSWKQRINDYEIDFSSFTDSAKILDIGCGPVSILELLPKTKIMVATDSLSEEYGKYFLKKQSNVKYKNFTAEKIPYVNDYFDVIFCLNALDHLERPFVALDEMLRVLNIEGRVYLEFENTSPLVKLLTKFGYKKPLNQFHPHLISFDNIEKYIKRSHKNVLIKIVKLRPEFDFNKVKYLMEIILGKRKMTKSETNISTISAGPLKFVFHYGVIFIERLLFVFNPQKYSYFNIIILEKVK